MPRHLLDAAMAGPQGSLWPEEVPHNDFDDYCMWHARKSQYRRHHHHAVNFTAEAAPLHPQEGPQGTHAGGNPHPPRDGGKPQVKEGDAEVLEWQAENGKTVFLSGDSEDACVADCKRSPEISDDTAGKSSGASAMSMMSGGGQQMEASCIRFCRTEFEIQCFPASSTVVVRNQGRIPLSKLRLGDSVLVMQRSGQDAKNWSLRFEPVISWLHREPDAQLEVVQVRHTMGEVRLTPDHLLFVRKAGDGAVASIVARDISIGDRVLAPWLDGSLAEPEVIEVSRRKATGAYCPLLPSGALLVDNTAVSCYCIPHALANDSVFAPLLKVLNHTTGMQSSHEAAHALFLPVRLLHQVVAQWQDQLCNDRWGQTVKDSSCAVQDRVDNSLDKPSETIHPYGRFMYVLATCLLSPPPSDQRAGISS